MDLWISVNSVGNIKTAKSPQKSRKQFASRQKKVTTTYWNNNEALKFRLNIIYCWYFIYLLAAQPLEASMRSWGKEERGKVGPTISILVLGRNRKQTSFTRQNNTYCWISFWSWRFFQNIIWFWSTSTWSIPIPTNLNFISV